MNYTAEELRQIADAIEAENNGKPVEFRWSGYAKWKNAEPPMMGPCDDKAMGKRRLYRPKPEPISRPWSKPSDVPGPVVWVRPADRTADNAALEALLITVSPVCLTFFTNYEQQCPWSSVSTLEYSTDRCNWQPCVVKEP